MTELPKAAVDRLIREGGAERVASDAVVTMANILQDLALDVASKANRIAKHSGRKTVTADDMKIAAKA